MTGLFFSEFSALKLKTKSTFSLFSSHPLPRNGVNFRPSPEPVLLHRRSSGNWHHVEMGPPWHIILGESRFFVRSPHHHESGNGGLWKVEVWSEAEHDDTDVSCDNSEDRWAQEARGEQEIWHGYEPAATWRQKLGWTYHFLYCTLFDDSISLFSTDPILTVWMIVTICAAGIILILLLILAFILFRRRQVH